MIDIANSETVSFDNIQYNDNAELLIKLSGDRTKDIKLTNTDTDNAKEFSVFNAGANKSALVKE